MIANIATFIVLLALSFSIANVMASQHRRTKPTVYRWLILFHVVLSLAYYLYAVFNPSDSWAYYYKVDTNFRGSSWIDFYGVSTPFIEFLGYPFVKYFGLPYESLMMIFAWLGLLGFFYFYIFFTEQVRFTHKFFGIDLILLILFLPNLHFWSASFGKGAVIFLGIGLYFYGINRVTARFIPLVIGAVLVYHVRPHVLFLMLVATAIGFAFSSKGVNWFLRAIVSLTAVLAFYYIYDDVMSLIGFDEEDLIEQSADLTRRIEGLSRATSGVDLTSYNFPMKLFTFLFRPLFVDAPGMLGWIVSFENLFYLLCFVKILRLDFVSFMLRSDYVVKTAFICFLGVSAALAQISSNLGLAMRQKSQVMMLIMFVIIAYLDDAKSRKWRTDRRKKRRPALHKEPIARSNSVQ